MQSVDEVLKQAAQDLDAIGARWAIIGGLAVAFRSEPRFTKDVDMAVAVADDQEAEDIVKDIGCNDPGTRLQPRPEPARRSGGDHQSDSETALSSPG